MTHLAWAKFAVYLRRDLDAERIRNCFRNLANRYAAAAADVHWQSVKLIRFGRQQVRPCDVFNERKIACLLAIFIEHWR